MLLFNCFMPILFAEMECVPSSPPEAVVIDSLFSMDQQRSGDKTLSNSNGKAGRDIAEVAAATELLLPKGSLRITSSVRKSFAN